MESAIFGENWGLRSAIFGDFWKFLGILRNGIGKNK